MTGTYEATAMIISGSAKYERGEHGALEVLAIFARVVQDDHDLELRHDSVQTSD